MSPARRKRILLAHGDRCVVSGCEYPGPYRLDHILALARGGPDTDENMQPLCKKHDDLKTFGLKHQRLGADLYEIAKTKRIIRKRDKPKARLRKIKSRGFDKTLRKKMNGQVEKIT